MAVKYWILLGPPSHLTNPPSLGSFQVDCWAVGVLAYELLFGAAPFNNKNRAYVTLNIVSKEPFYDTRKGMSFMSINFIKTALSKV